MGRIVGVEVGVLGLGCRVLPGDPNFWKTVPLKWNTGQGGAYAGIMRNPFPFWWRGFRMDETKFLSLVD